MSVEMKDFGAHAIGQTPPDLALQHRAIDVARTHPFFQEASAHPYCEPMVFVLEGEKFVEIRKRLPKIVAGLDRAVGVVFITSTVIPQPLCGGGKSYEFILHPESMEILDATIGEWKS